MGSSKEHHLIGKAHAKALRIMHAMRNGHLYRSVDGINWGLEEHPSRVGPVAEGYTKITLCRQSKANKNI